MLDNTSISLVSLIGLLLGVFLYGFFALVRTAIIRARASALKQEPHINSFGTAKARVLLARANYHINLAQAGTFLAGGIAFICALSFLSSLRPESNSLYFTLLFITFALVSFFGVVSSGIQRGLAYKDPNLMLRLVAHPFSFLGLPLIPIAWASSKLLSWLTCLGLKVPKERDLIVSAEQISEMVEISSIAGEIEDEERERIQGVFEFTDTTVSEVMTPRQDIIAITASATVAEAVTLLHSAKHSRILVYGTDIDDVKGVLIAKDLLSLVGKNVEGIAISSYIRKVMHVKSDSPVDDLLERFKKHALHFAVVVDEHGGVDGIVTLEDLIEELVGEIYDEHDEPAEEQDCQETSSGDLIVDGGALIDDLNSEYELHLPIGEYDTIAGYVIHELGTIPDIGDSVSYNGYLIKVEELDNNRVVQLRIQRSTQEASNN